MNTRPPSVSCPTAMPTNIPLNTCDERLPVMGGGVGGAAQGFKSQALILALQNLAMSPCAYQTLSSVWPLKSSSMYLSGMIYHTAPNSALDSQDRSVSPRFLHIPVPSHSSGPSGLFFLTCVCLLRYGLKLCLEFTV